MIQIFMGWDDREIQAYKLAEYSITSRTSTPLIIHSLEKPWFLTRPTEWRKNGNGVDQLWCPISDAPMSTAFAISRFCVPFLRKKGLALFVDCDIICQTDIANLFALADPRYAIQVVKHNHFPTEQYHDAGQLQTFYQRKNWSSVVLWNLDHPANKRFTIENLNTWPGRDLHAFKWLADNEIGELPEEWNYLVGVNKPADLKAQKILHYTNGHPGWENWEPQPTDSVYNEELLKYKKYV